MKRCVNGICLLMVLVFAGCGGGKPETGPVTEKVKPANPEDIKKSLETSFEKMKEMNKQRQGQGGAGADPVPAKTPEIGK